MLSVSKRQIRRLLAGIFILTIFLSWGNSLTIYAKAYLAEFLIASAWRQTLIKGRAQKPWTWADTWPVGKLYFPKQKLSLYVLAGSHGSSLAFGPGHMDGTALPSEAGTKVISAHRDTHFAFLKNLEAGDFFMLQGSDGRWRYYRLHKTLIADSRQGPWLVDPYRDEVHLITCYPFDSASPSGPLRLVAIATRAFSDKP